MTARTGIPLPLRTTWVVVVGVPEAGAVAAAAGTAMAVFR